jgi:hypothetical protein
MTKVSAAPQRRRVDEHRVIGAAALAPMIALTVKLTEGRL